MSAEKEIFDYFLASELGAIPEYRFHPTRKWRFDHALPRKKIAFEYEGGGGMVKGRHTSFYGYSSDCEKYNHAALSGWKVFRFTAKMVKDGSFLGFMKTLRDETNKESN